MPRAKKHLLYGALASIPYLFLLFLFHHLGFLPLWDFLKFAALGSTAILIGSDLPDIDARSAPANEAITLMLPPAVFWGLLYFTGLNYVAATVLTVGSVVTFFEFLPSHRGLIHTARIGIFFGSLVSLSVYLLGLGIWLSSLAGISLLTGYLVHLAADNELKF